MMLMSCVKRSEVTLGEDGENMNVVISPDSKSIAVLTSKVSLI